MKYYQLDKEEEQIVEDFESGKYGNKSDNKNKLSAYQKYAQNSLNKNKNINIRLSEKDLLKIKSKAVSNGIPYQTLLTSLIHQYAEDRFSVQI